MLKFYFFCSVITLSCKVFAQPPANHLDVQHYNISLYLNDSTNIIRGKAGVTVKFTNAVDKVILDLVQKTADGKGMTVTAVSKKDSPLKFMQDADHLIIDDKAVASNEHIYTISYQGIPANGLIIDTNKYGDRTFFGDNWPNRAHNWFPCNDHPSDKATVEFAITAPEHYQVIANGLQIEETNLPGHLKLTRYREETPLPTKVMVIGAADFAVNYSGNAGNIPVYSWVYPQDRDKGFTSYAAAKDILPWFEQKIAPYPYKKLANVQSKTIFGGMENANAIFYFENSVTDKSLEALLVHEIAHQWFGNSASEQDWNHLWLSEGFATYMTHLYHQDKYGTDSMNNRLQTDRDEVVAFSQKRKTPVSDTTAYGNLMQLLNVNSYQKGGWVLHMLRNKVGDDLFFKSIRVYYNTYKGSNATTDNLREIFEDVCQQDLKDFFAQWIYTTGQPALSIEWQYNKRKKQVTFTITQTQEQLFTFPLAIKVDELATQTIAVSAKTTIASYNINNTPPSIVVDPDTKLLCTYTVTERK
ncbi:M1 family metallopeptidase [Panacibacter sp. DH6]|uniref:Aminopeptidase N n=1 Tax=Panacibacter microcysteis TaxID=2793269 RepID=A0A931E462_9BACT|nr:M1 family metallopeptidase [Panacibacter microcysteis]MBG9375216.1 M1 family metallopeptidase [Panacibacter microcysteis]